MATWYVKNADGKVFGPVEDARLVEWARDGRIEPFAGLSTDLKNWTLASLKPELEMDWLIENEPGRFYGPTNRAVVDDLLRSGSLAEGVRIYRDDHDGTVLKNAQREIEQAKQAIAELQRVKDAEVEALRNELEQVKREAEITCNARDAEIAQFRDTLSIRESEIAQIRSELSTRDAELERIRTEFAELQSRMARLTETKKREWHTEVVVPEVVSAEPPPSAARAVFAPGHSQTLADLERQAQSELARMGASGAKRFFGLR